MLTPAARGERAAGSFFPPRAAAMATTPGENEQAPDAAAAAFREFVAVVKALRTPCTGCPWDLEQDHRTLRPYLLEEAHEALDAIDRGDDRALQGELGDVLLQVVLHAQVAADRGAFAIADVVRGITEKMVRRHPHVFGSVRVSGADEVRHNWERSKAAEAGPAGAAAARVPESLPALLRAQRLGEKAARRLGDGPAAEALDRARQELAGLGSAGESRESQERRLGEALFALCQAARRLGLSAEDSLRECNRRFAASAGLNG